MYPNLHLKNVKRTDILRVIDDYTIYTEELYRELALHGLREEAEYVLHSKYPIIERKRPPRGVSSPERILMNRRTRTAYVVETLERAAMVAYELQEMIYTAYANNALGLDLILSDSHPFTTDMLTCRTPPIWVVIQDRLNRVPIRFTPPVDEFYIATHPGFFHCDEALAAALIQIFSQNTTSLPIVRTRDPYAIAGGCFVVDVGGVYDHARRRYDHHQPSFREVFSSRQNTIKLSSAGLVYKHYGQDIIRQLYPALSDESRDAVFERMYTTFFEHIDAHDNGMENGKDERYLVTTTLSARVGYLNPSAVGEDEHEAFRRAMKLTCTEFLECLHRTVTNWLPGREPIQKAIANRFEVHSSGSIVHVPGHCDARQYPMDPSILYLIIGMGLDWKVICVLEKEGGFKPRKALPEAWRGLQDEALRVESKIRGAVFVHSSGFMGVASSYADALEMAIRSLE